MKRWTWLMVVLFCCVLAGSGRTALAESEDWDEVYLYHPVRLVLEEQDAKVAFWHSSDNNVVSVNSDGIVVAEKEGFAEITAYGVNGLPIQSFLLRATTSANADPFGMSFRSMDRYKRICYENVKEEINTITDYACWLFANDVFYSMDQEASNPMYQYAGDAYWMQMADSSWIFKNRAGICCTVAAGAQYALLGDYEENGLIYMAGAYGHVINYFKENGEYLVVDFTCNISDGNRVINESYRGNVLAYTMDMVGRGATLQEAFANYVKDGRGSFYLENHIIYAMDLTGLDYYPAEANNWSQGKSFENGVNILYAAEGTKLETLYVKEGILFQVEYVKRSDIPAVMQVVTKPDTALKEEMILLGAVPELKAKTYRKTSAIFSADCVSEDVTARTQEELLKYVDYSAKAVQDKKNADRKVLYLSSPEQLDVKEKAAFFVSTDANVVRVSGNGTVVAYAEGVADVYAYDNAGKLLQEFRFITKTKADNGPLKQTLQTVEQYKDIPYEDIPEQLSTITDVVCWMYASNAFYEGYREPKPPMAVQVNYAGEGYIHWMQMANSNWMFKDLSGICCNMAAAAQYALAGDYEEHGLIFMSGKYGHVINYFKENGIYYIFDYTTAAGGGNIRYEYNGDVERFAKEKTGQGTTLKEALDDYIKKGSGNFYYENFVIYSMDLTGLNYYPAECNNWCNDPLEKIYERVNTLYVMEGTRIEVLYLEDKVKFEAVEMKRDEIPPYMEVVLTERVK